MRWDIFCRVIDNHGDIGVSWRLSADLASRGERVRLWVDDPGALAWMAPDGRDDVQVVHWTAEPPDLMPGEVVVETFGCDPPEAFVRRMAEQTPAPLWINLEYLSAESYVERSHGLRSPVTLAPGVAMAKRFFYPGFTGHTGGLLREPGLLQAQLAFDRVDWVRGLGLVPAPGEMLVSLFGYRNAALPALVERLAATPTLLLVAPGAATEQIAALLGPALRSGALRAHLLPYLSQTAFDRLLWACDLNFVRGEDSFVRAQWAGKPFVWQIYPQQDAAHGAKLGAFLDLMLERADDAIAASLRRFWLGWNGLGALPGALPEAGAWHSLAQAWRATLLWQPDLVTGLLRFVAETR